MPPPRAGDTASACRWLLGQQPSVFSSENRWLDGGRRCTRVLASVPVISPEPPVAAHWRDLRGPAQRAPADARIRPQRTGLRSSCLSARTFPATATVCKAGHVSGIRRQPAYCDRLLGRYSGFERVAATRMAGRWPSRRTIGSRGRDWLDAGRPLSTPPLGGRFPLPADRRPPRRRPPT